MIACGLLLFAAMQAATPPPLPVAPGRGVATMKAAGMSDAGISVLRQQSAPDPDAKALLDRRAALRQQLAAAAQAQPFDVDRLADLLKQSSQLDSNVRARNDERIIDTLRALPPGDRSIFAKQVFAPLLRGGERPPPPRP